MNRTSATPQCRTLFFNMYMLSDKSLNVLLAVNLLVTAFNLIVNGLLIYIMKVTRQYLNSSLRLTMYMSISDFFVALISQQMMTYYLLKAHSTMSCQRQVLCQYILYLFPHATGFFVGIVALDRYIRVKYTNRYNEVMTFKRQTIGVLVICVLAILNCMVLISGIFTGNWKAALLGVQPLDMTFVTFDIALYWRAIVLMNEHIKNNNEEIKHLSKSISRLATIYLVLVIIFYPPYLVTDLIVVFLDTQNTAIVFWHIMSLIWVFLNSGVNAISFLIVNRKAQTVISEWKSIVCYGERNKQQFQKALKMNDKKFDSISTPGNVD